MKLFGLLLLVATAGQISAQTDFVDYLLQLQYVTENVSGYMSNYLAEARAELSLLLTELNDQGITEITEGLHAVIAIRDRTEGAVAEVSTEDNAECIAEVTSNWPMLLEVVGDAIADCADEHVEPIHNETETFHLFVQQQNRVVFDAQNMVLNVFTHLDPLISAEEITPTIEAGLDDLIEEFENVVKPELGRIINDIRFLRYQVPEEIHTCINSSVGGFNDAAVDIYNNLLNC